MHRWNRAGDLVVGNFTSAQIGWLHRHLDGFAALVHWRTRQYHTDYPLGSELGLPLPVGPTDDLRLLAILDWYCCEEDSDEVRLWREPDLFAALRRDIDAVQATLPEPGEAVLLRDQLQVHAWIRVLLDYRIAAAITWQIPDAVYDLRRQRPEPDDEFGRAFYLTTWLWDVVRDLAETADLIAAP